MNSMNASLDRDRLAAMRTADQVCHLLRGFIPERCLLDARQALFEACHQQGVELTTKLMRKEYEAWKSTQLDMLGMKP